MIDFLGCGARELSGIYQAFALLCARQQVRGALLKTGDEAAEAHYALRDTLVTVARIAEIPLNFGLALVASSDPIEAVCRAVQGELRSLGCDARVFRMERQADRWLCGGPAAGVCPRRNRFVLAPAHFRAGNCGSSLCSLSYACLMNPRFAAGRL